MRHLLFAFIVLLAATFLGIQLNKDPGYILIAINHWTLETTVWVGVFTLMLLFLVAHIFLRLCHQLVSLPKTIHQWRTNRMMKKANEATQKGLIEYNEGYWLKAKKHLIKALPNTDMPVLNYLTAARAAQKIGDSQSRDDYLRKAQQTMPEAKIAVELTQAELFLDNNQWEQALATLKHLHDVVPSHPYVLMLLMNLYKQIRDWPQLIALIPMLKKNQVISAQELEQLQLTAYLQAIGDLAQQNQAQAITQLVQSLPKSLRNNPLLIAEQAKFLVLNNDPVQAEILLRNGLKKQFDPQLIELYGQIQSNDQQLVFAESLLKNHADSAALQLCLGRLCLAKQLWGKAKNYLMQSNTLQPSPITYNELGKLHEQLHDANSACECYKKGLELANK